MERRAFSYPVLVKIAGLNEKQASVLGASLLAGGVGALGGAAFSQIDSDKPYNDLDAEAKAWGIPKSSKEYKEAVKKIRKQNLKNMLISMLYSGGMSAGLTALVNMRR